MTTISPYLNFKGRCEEAFNFYKSVFGTEFLFVGRFKDMPDNPNYTIKEEEKEKIMHISLPISKESVIFGCDNLQVPDSTDSSNNVSLSLETDSIEEATRIFKGLSAGGKVIMPLDKTFWDAYYGMFTDKYGINWMVNYDLSKTKTNN